MAWRRFLDATRADASRRRREDLVDEEPAPGPAPAPAALQLYFLCAHPSLTPASAVALTLRAVDGLTTRHARRAARTAVDGSLVPLAEQDRGRWNPDHRAGTASGVLNTSRQIGEALAVAVFGALLTTPAGFLHGLRTSLLIAAVVALAATAASLLLVPGPALRGRPEHPTS